jgi:hypothetical protein
MKHLWVLFLLLSLHSYAGITVISDLDDTIKITNAGSKANATFNGLFTKRVFTGMTEFFEETKSYANALHVVTASPSIIRPRVKATLAANGIEADGVYLKPLFRGEDKISFKVRVIKSIMDETSDDVILMGDDVDKDPEVYTEIQKSFPERVLGTYIHVVRNRPVPETMTRYWTTFDLALREFLSGRMALASVKKVGESLLQASKLSRIFPKFANCPWEASVFEWQLQTVFIQEAQELTEKLNQYCLSRAGKDSL